MLATYYKAKIEADEVLYKVSKHSSSLIGINLRPGTLTLEPAGKIALGKTGHPGSALSSREAVAETASALLASEGIKNTWLDLLDGDEDIQAAVDRVVRDGVDAAEGDPVYNS